ncbi:MAG TPA: DUF3303 family protein [Steroidobacteraceae bacterium]|nr:DUF3303 family protein [Steroidobacteraceae bacterium]
MLYRVVETFNPGAEPEIYRRARELLDAWISKWRDLTRFEVIPVRTSAEASRLIADRS